MSSDQDEIPAGDRRDFDRWATWLHIGAWVAVLAFVLINWLFNPGWGVGFIGVALLALFLGLGWAVTSLIGRWMARRTALWVALILPALSALLLGGTCVSLMGGLPGVGS